MLQSVDLDAADVFEVFRNFHNTKLSHFVNSTFSSLVHESMLNFTEFKFSNITDFP